MEYESVKLLVGAYFGLVGIALSAITLRHTLMSYHALNERNKGVVQTGELDRERIVVTSDLTGAWLIASGQFALLVTVGLVLGWAPPRPPWVRETITWIILLAWPVLLSALALNIVANAERFRSTMK